MNIQLRLSNYIMRYAPSHKKVSAYLLSKKIANPDNLLSEMGYDESLMCDMWFRSFLSLGKGRREMYQNLLKKEFPKAMIEEKITLLEDEIVDWSSHKNQVEHQIRTLLERGKSLKIIASLLVSRYPYFRDEIVEYIESLDDGEGLKKEVQKYKNKYNLNIPSEKQKFYVALMRKGFGYQQIKEQLAISNQ